MATETEAVQVEVVRPEGLMVVTLNRERKRNALNDAMYKRLTALLRQADRTADIHAVVLTGRGTHFCAGQDLTAVDPVQRAQSRSRDLPVGHFMDALIQFQKLLVAAVNGPAIGIGATLLAHCDLVIAHPSASVSTPFAALGVVPELGSSYTFPRRLGIEASTRLLLLGETLSAQECYQRGLYSHVLEPVDNDTAPPQASNQAATDVLNATLALLRRGAARDAHQGGSWLLYRAMLLPPAERAHRARAVATELDHIDKRFRTGDMQAILHRLQARLLPSKL
ncbi:uncharacterized protein MONBRDRAFT_9867 [Monosiga brevicollis MX1]|uniref:Enoyl-CoA hydratase n=1 Tax=Monosiga brevicollis TaxID=81824 RepID=A9V4G8_MONBE|nr:uncharacterized protein MONBRDRAFT_9867 [Monosiga brevicollis MX1]EDQ87612.1 predicted protein [Monosiga brevicollis MX1]|eukprot:XP_001747532.1 hypothetical protein [Monosiga brevicollis MX1]